MIFNQSIVIFLVILFGFAVKAEVLKFDVTGFKRDIYTYQQVCQKMGHKNLIIVEPKNVMHMDCMGELVNIKDFCLKENPSKHFLRGYINEKMKEVVCTRGSSALLSIACDKRDKIYCKEPKSGCERLNKVYASAHELEYHTLIKKDVDDVLNCYYKVAAPKKEKKRRFVIPGEEPPVIGPDLFGKEVVKKSNIEILSAP